MKIAKILSAAAACAVAATALAVSASAELTVADSPVSNLTSATGSWMIKLYVPSEGIDLGLDLSKIGGVRFTLTAAEPEWFEGNTGGGVVFSCGPTSVTPADHNWASSNWWGVVDEDLGIDTHDDAAAAKTVKVGDYTYSITVMTDDTNCIYADEVTASPDGYVQIALQEWGNDMSAITVTGMDLLDASGNAIASFDGNGNMTSGSAPSTPSTPDEPADDNTNTTTPTTPSTDKGSPDTGVAGVAAAAGVAALAAGAVVLTKKRK